MLTTMNIFQSTASIHQNNQFDLAGGEHIDLDKICPGCTLTAVTDDGGLVVAFGQSFFHVDCFKCAKCGNKVTGNTNLLLRLLSDGSPVCASCSYNCNVCQLPILDEAIMTGDDSYHVHCFKCKVCLHHIDGLVFAKTSKGIYCMDCHNERLIKNRKHAQRKAEREKAGGSASSRDGKYKRENGQPLSVTVASPVDNATPSRPLLAHQSSTSSEQTIHQEGRANGPLDVATSARDKRRSINPSLPAASPPAAASPSLSPIAASFLQQQQQQGSRSATPPRQNGTDSSYVASPRREHFENDANNDGLQYHGSMNNLGSGATSRPPSPWLETFHSDYSGQSTPDMSQTSLRPIFPSYPSSIQHPDNAPSLTWKDLLATSYPEVWQLEDIIADHNSRPWQTVSELRPDQFQTVMDGLQLILDYSPHMESASRTAAIKCLQAISALSGCLPTSMTIENVFTERDTPSFGGGFADVWFGQVGSQRVALKVLRTFGNDDDDDYIRTSKAFRQEALLWRQLRHPNILPFLGVNTTTFFPRPCLISPCMKNGNINQFLQRQPTHNRMQVIIEVMEGIQFLHSHETPLVHADIRGANILVQDGLTCCLADFGLTTVVDSRVASSRINGGAARWLAPESFLFNESTGCQADHIPSRDIYAFGCTVIEICSGKAPFPNIRNDPAILAEVLLKKKKPLPSPTTFLMQAVWDVVDQCLAFEAMDRPDAGEVLRCLRGPLDRLIDQLNLDP